MKELVEANIRKLSDDLNIAVNKDVVEQLASAVRHLCAAYNVLTQAEVLEAQLKTMGKKK